MKTLLTEDYWRHTGKRKNKLQNKCIINQYACKHIAKWHLSVYYSAVVTIWEQVSAALQHWLWF